MKKHKRTIHKQSHPTSDDLKEQVLYVIRNHIYNTVSSEIFEISINRTADNMSSIMITSRKYNWAVINLLLFANDDGLLLLFKGLPIGVRNELLSYGDPDLLDKAVNVVNNELCYLTMLMMNFEETLDQPIRVVNNPHITEFACLEIKTKLL